MLRGLPGTPARPANQLEFVLVLFGKHRDAAQRPLFGGNLARGRLVAWIGVRAH
jgi:hypothetical protein